MTWAKKETYLKSCAITDNTLLQVSTADGNDTETRSQLEENGHYLEKLQAMSELQRAIITQLMPIAPRAMHSGILREAAAPFLKARDKKEQRHEFEAAVAPLVQNGLVRYFCCIIDSYAMNPRHMGIARYLPDQSTPFE
ncbi:MAG: hypothetical protein WCI87_06435 [Euryarchaeota archaeon]